MFVSNTQSKTDKTKGDDCPQYVYIAHKVIHNMLFSTIAGHAFCNKHIYISQTPILLANTVHYKAMYNSDLTPGRKPPRYALIINGIFTRDCTPKLKQTY